MLAALKHPSIRSSTDEIAAALTGDYRAEHVFVLQQELYFYEIYRTQIEACDVQIEQCLSAFVDKINVSKSPLPKPKRSGKPSTNAPSFDLRTHLYRICGVDFTRITGMGVLTVQTLVSELGLDPTRFPTVKHFTSWLGPAKATTATAHKLAHIFYRLWTTGGEYRTHLISFEMLD